MAKLTDVNVLDMQGGKVTRVSYAGAEYVASEGGAQVGDLVRAKHTTTDLTSGGFYEIYRIDYGEGFAVYDNIGDSNALIADVASGIFRKQSAQLAPVYTQGLQAPTLTQRVDAIDARVSALESAKSGVQPAPLPPKPAFKVGDYAKVTGAATFIQHLAAGDIVEVSSDGTHAFDFRVSRITDGAEELFDAADLEPATDADVAQAKRAAKFAALGRADGELHLGDLVRVVKNCGAPYEDDSVHVVLAASHTSSARISAAGYRVVAELLAPVEARVDAD